MNRQFSRTRLAKHRDTVAAWLSVIPGLGQLYKGHYLEATGVAFATIALVGWLGTLLCLSYAFGVYGALLGASIDWVGLLLNPVTIYMGLLPLLMLWAWVVFDAFDEPDLRHPVPNTRRARARDLHFGPSRRHRCSAPNPRHQLTDFQPTT